MTAIELSINEVNELPSDQFIKIFGNIVEHYTPLSISILKYRPFNTAEDISKAADTYLDQLSNVDKEKVLNLHPDLSGKLNLRLTSESQFEQNSAGLLEMNQEEKTKLNNFNEKYKNKFGFPFVLCARENTVSTIFINIEKRLENNKEIELLTGIEEVKKICKLRINEIII
ncbi:2-oxo-4-hydroxy-4-carboxy-5-ureidoimidazoline decarboxylase-like [Onthophagus taurus]|uniref:2-oxo-4-hydroxy-4-carboxy-5-ureidoimidazoline decarboxylase-like n=1 Tax=Onthophagus taurus TaxID=166361 RepID=UPI000C207D04|nr:2-oxo-4-hydroxy-4-carboxy-5-ureidoimidazoline decarboxylase-like [Onthophagus taurus]